ncbi:MAG TPA: winged helix domain-containing protein, partial [Casimicrobiaceae bacterium]|nr:winged helix domain-containing protein [Casimicrobiaceae bacterium]
KPNIYFTPPARRLTARAFAAAAARRGLALDARTQLLYDGRWVFINGAAIARPARGAAAIERLADARGMASGEPGTAASAELLYRWYCDGYLHLD